jgi:hypothetical protein
MKKREFDCVEMMHRSAEIVQAKMAGMTREEQAAFLQEQTDLLRRRQAELREQRKAS